MNLQVAGGESTVAYIDGSKKAELLCSILYRDAAAASNVTKSAMLGTLNGIGQWMHDLPSLPLLGKWLLVGKNRIGRIINRSWARDRGVPSIFLATFPSPPPPKKQSCRSECHQRNLLKRATLFL